jgi:hypothetical protein
LFIDDIFLYSACPSNRTILNISINLNRSRSNKAKPNLSVNAQNAVNAKHSIKAFQSRRDFQDSPGEQKDFNWHQDTPRA